MTMFKERRRPAIRTLRGWAISVLLESGAAKECDEHGWMQDRADPDARARALDIAGQHPPAARRRDVSDRRIRVGRTGYPVDNQTTKSSIPVIGCSPTRYSATPACVP